MRKVCCLLLCLFTGSVNAGLMTIEFGPSSGSGKGPLITFDDLITPKTIVGDAIFTLNIAGDFATKFEYADLMIDDFSLGRIFNNKTDDDLFDFNGDDTKSNNWNQKVETSTATISESIFSRLIADGMLDLSFQASRWVDCCSSNGSVSHISGSITFDDGISVPEPALLALFGLGLVGFGFSSRKRRWNEQQQTL
jgi:hypothetical protein